MTTQREDLVSKRLRYIDRQRELAKHHVPGTRGVPAGSGPANRHGMPKLPIGQHVVKNWPVLDLGDVPDVSLDRWSLEVGGLVENPVTLTWDAFMALPQVDEV